jgi:hypothetical protein
MYVWARANPGRVVVASSGFSLGGIEERDQRTTTFVISHHIRVLFGKGTWLSVSEQWPLPPSLLHAHHNEIPFLWQLSMMVKLYCPKFQFRFIKVRLVEQCYLVDCYTIGTVRQWESIFGLFLFLFFYRICIVKLYI